MILTQSLLKQSFLKENSTINRKESSRVKKSVAATLMLTSLIDAFSILVVYLLMFFSNAGDMAYVNADIILPNASSLERLDRYSIIQVKKTGYFIEDKLIKKSELVAYLVDLKKKLVVRAGGASNLTQTITIQADKSLKYTILSPIIQACSQAGFGEIKFAVLGE